MEFSDGFAIQFLSLCEQSQGNIKPKIVEVTKDNPDHVNIIAQLETEKKDLLQRLSEAQNSKPKGLVLNFTEEWEKYIWGVLEISKKDGYAKSYEELIIKMFQVLHARKELMLDAADYEYLKTLENGQ